MWSSASHPAGPHGRLVQKMVNWAPMAVLKYIIISIVKKENQYIIIYYKAGILRTSISDHYGIFSISKKATMSSNNSVIKKRSFFDKYICSSNNRQANESCDYETDSAQLAFTRFQGVIKQHFEYNLKCSLS